MDVSKSYDKTVKAQGPNPQIRKCTTSKTSQPQQTNQTKNSSLTTTRGEEVTSLPTLARTKLLSQRLRRCALQLAKSKKLNSDEQQIKNEFGCRGTEHMKVLALGPCDVGIEHDDQTCSGDLCHQCATWMYLIQ